ncbi:MAG TPA: hypothetical protein VJQ06_05230 [Rhizomicrobium sp.]|nr:hypothetical protein [Rhizomicrobium sp.]
MILPKAPASYDSGDEQRTRHAITQEDKLNRKTTSDVEVGKQRLVLTSPNGSRWSLSISNGGVLSTTAL